MITFTNQGEGMVFIELQNFMDYLPCASSIENSSKRTIQLQNKPEEQLQNQGRWREQKVISNDSCNVWIIKSE